MTERHKFRRCVIEVATRKVPPNHLKKASYQIASVSITRNGQDLGYAFSQYNDRDENEVYREALLHAKLFIAARYAALVPQQRSVAPNVIAHHE